MQLLKQPFPTAPAASYLTAGNLLCRKGRFSEALQAFALGIRTAPKDPILYFSFGVAAHLLGRLREAKAAYRTALLLRPNFAEVQLHLGNLLYDEGRYLPAAASYWQAIQSKPHFAKAYCNLGNAMLALGRTPEAVACLSRAIALDPEMHKARHNLGNALLASRQYESAEECFRKLLCLDPEQSEHPIGLGNSLLQQCRTAEAEECYRSVLRKHPDLAIAHANLANALLEQGKPEESKHHARWAIELDPTSAGANYNLALSCLREGNYLEGWRRHEFRWGFRELHLWQRNFPQPQWTGQPDQPLKGKTILLHAEQGMGDTIQFVRYLSLFAGSGAGILLEVQPSLKRLIEQSPQTGPLAACILSRGEQLPKFDYHCPLMSLPLAFKTMLESIPGQRAYLQADSAEVTAAWRAYPRRQGRLRVGLAWAGNPNFKRDKRRSIPLEALMPLAGLPQVDFFSLQNGEAARQMDALKERFPIRDAASTSKDFAATAARMATLDLVISVDTAIAHLAGAMELPVWVLLPHQADWRWLADRSDSPWYPTAQLFRQPAPGDWESVAAALCRQLQSFNQAPVKSLPKKNGPEPEEQSGPSERCWRTSEKKN
jgi:tetratricopeptide (TPR) repeat protein